MRRRMMLKSKAPVSGNGLVDGDYTPSNTSSSETLSVYNNVITLHIPIGSTRQFIIPLQEPITLNSGDTVVFSSTPVVSGSGFLSDPYLVNSNGETITTLNQQWDNNLQFSADSTLGAVSNSGGVATGIRVSAHWFQTGDDRSLRLSLKINGEVIF